MAVLGKLLVVKIFMELKVPSSISGTSSRENRTVSVLYIARITRLSIMKKMVPQTAVEWNSYLKTLKLILLS